MYTQSNKKKIAIIGGGAAGLMAAGTAIEFGADVTIFEHMHKTGLKLGITGKGRCNVTNDSNEQEFLQSVVTNPRFLYSAIYSFSSKDTQAFFENIGVPLKVERGNRVFPVSDQAQDIVRALRKYAGRAEIIYEHVSDILVKDGKVIGVHAKEDYFFDAVIICTGGISYPATGSDGSGFEIVKKIGHSVTPLMPSLVPLTSNDPICSDLQGLSLKNVSLKILDGNKVIYDDFGEMLFTHFGISGPMVLSASAHLHKQDISKLKAEIDLKPALTPEELDKRLLSDFNINGKKDYINELAELLPSKMIEPFAIRTKIPFHKKVNELNRENRKVILNTLKHFQVSLSGYRPIKEAIVTNGGVQTKEINPKTMESKLVKNLFFAGEMIDCDAYTGGFNLQIAFSTAKLAAEHAALSREDNDV